MKKWPFTTNTIKALFLFTVLLGLNETLQAEEVKLNLKLAKKNADIKINGVEAKLISSTSNPFCISYGINPYIGLPMMDNTRVIQLRAHDLGKNSLNISGTVDSGICFYKISEIIIILKDMETKLGKFSISVRLYNWKPNSSRNYLDRFDGTGYYRYPSKSKIDSKCVVGEASYSIPRLSLNCTTYGYSHDVDGPVWKLNPHTSNFSIETTDNSFIGSEIEIDIDDSQVIKTN